MLNNVTLLGRLTRDPELRYTQSQTPVASFTIAVDRDFNKDECDFIPCTAWKKTAEFVNRYFKKGELMCMSGRLQTRKYTDKEGQNRVSYEVVCEHVYFAQSKQRLENGTLGVNVDATGFQDMDGDDSSLPF